MRTLLLLVAFTAPAFAQDAPTPLPPSALVLGLDVAPIAEIASARFPDAQVTGPTFAAGESVRVLFVDGARVRVRKGDRYGWVPADQLGPVPAL
jgi:hypothetical protein